MNANNDTNALKSGIWYILEIFTTKGILFFTIPIFARLMSHDEFGLYSNYESLLRIFSVFVTLNLSASFISARFDFAESFEKYVLSLLSLSTVSSLTWLVIINFFSDWFISVTDLNIKYLNIIIIYLLFFSVIDIFIARERFIFRYKTLVLTNLAIESGKAILSVILTICMSNKLDGRILGTLYPTVMAGVIIFYKLKWKVRETNFKYWHYALPICLPYIPHLLSLTVLNSIDKLMITKICGPGYNALYSLAYSCGIVVTLLVISLNNAFSPWLGEQMKNENVAAVRTVASRYLLLFAFLASGFMLIAPELLLIMGGESYNEAVYVIPPVALGCVFQFVYTMYVNIEQFKRKTVGMALASILAAAINFVLNIAFIPRYGYIAAAYTTAVSYLCLMMIHMFLVFKIGYLKIYDITNTWVILFVMAIYAVLINYLYSLYLIRYSMILMYILVFVYLYMKNKEHILALFGNRIL